MKVPRYELTLITVIQLIFLLMFSAMMVSPLFCMRPSPVWLGKLPVPRKFSGEKENMIVIHYDVFFSSCSKKIKLILSCPEDMVMGDQVAN